VIIHHGHTKGAGVNFIKQLVHDLNIAGFQAVVMVRRGIESNLLSTPTLYKCEGMNEDILEAVEYLENHFHDPNFYSVGISMGS
jgi:predicted alpha/beta-fold hydrolase